VAPLDGDMHELSLAQSLIQASIDEAARHGASRVVSVDLVIGALAGVEPEALSFCFPVAAAGTVCDGAELRIEIEPATGRCASCTSTSEVRDLMSSCPQCGAWPLGLTGGREMRLRALEVT
jgi:hydrogenase nickel incorporation protein HypA/HybF